LPVGDLVERLDVRPHARLLDFEQPVVEPVEVYRT
jgi:hypothetical protein